MQGMEGASEEQGVSVQIANICIYISLVISTVVSINMIFVIPQIVLAN